MSTRKEFVRMILFLVNELLSYNYFGDCRYIPLLQFCAGQKAHFMDKENVDWAPSILLPECEINDEESDFRDAMPNTPSELEQLEFDYTLIQKETSEINEIVTSLENCDETMYLAQPKMPENINADAAQYISILRKVILAQAKRIDELTAKLRLYQFDLESFRNNDEKTRYYTGMPEFSILEALFKEVEPYITLNHKSNLTKSQMLILCLMKLRLGIHFCDLGYRFDVSHITASRTFYSMVDVLYNRIGNVVFAPAREDVKLTMPQVFKRNFGDDVVYIIDCTEIFIEVPSNPETSVQCWSSYKKRHTIKFLIAISPQGAIVFISFLFG